MARWLGRIVRLAPVRLVIGLVILIAGSILVQVALKGLGGFGLPRDARLALETVIAVATSVLLYLGFVRWVERRRPAELAGAGAARELGVGLVLGTVLISASVGLIALLGGYTESGVDPGWSLAPAAAMAITSGVSEEILVRGVVFRLLEEWLGTWAALVISAALFGAAHLTNPHATWASGVAIALEAGGYRVYATLVAVEFGDHHLQRLGRAGQGGRSGSHGHSQGGGQQERQAPHSAARIWPLPAAEPARSSSTM